MMSKIKKVWLALALSVMLLVAPPVFALDWHTANQSTVAWDAVVTDVDGNTVPAAGERVTYVVYLANSVTDPNKANPVEVGSTQALTFLITLGTKGSYYAGVKAVLEADDGAGGWVAANESAIVWSDDPQYVQDGVTFGLRFYPAPSAITGLRPE
jgi:hypothetical protein